MMFSLWNSFKRAEYSYCVYRKLLCRSKYYSRQSFRNSENLKKPIKHKKFPLFIKEEKKLAPKIDSLPMQKFDFFLVLDFEATCDSPINVEPPEIIEFPVRKVDGKTLNVVSTFHSYVKPIINPQLSSFCTELTGIIQGMVETHPVFPVVYENFLNWMDKEDILKPEVKFAFVTCGDTDLDHFFPVQCKVSQVEVPDFMQRWINIKRSFCEISPYIWPDNLLKMLEYCELESEGEPHSGLDDSKNIARVLKDLAERGLVFDFNGWKKI